MYYLCSENKSADQLHSGCAADLHLCFCICKKPVFLLLGSNYNLQKIDVRLSNFCFLDADCLVVGESQGSSQSFAVKPTRPKGDSQTYIPLQEQLNSFSNNQQFLLVSPSGFEPAWQRYLAYQMPTALPTELSKIFQKNFRSFYGLPTFSGF